MFIISPNAKASIVMTELKSQLDSTQEIQFIMVQMKPDRKRPNWTSTSQDQVWNIKKQLNEAKPRAVFKPTVTSEQYTSIFNIMSVYDRLKVLTRVLFCKLLE